MHAVSRREFVGYLAATLAVPYLGGTSRLPWSRGIRLAVTHCRSPESVIDHVSDGIAMGIDEAQRSAQLFGGSVTYRFVSLGEDPLDAVGDAIQIVIPGVLEESAWRPTIASAAAAGAIVFNANSWTGEPYAMCERHVFHVRPSPRTLRAIRAAGKATAGGTMELWSPSLTRFGADTLNKRFRARRGKRMDSSAWAGWFAVKCAWEALLQSRATTASQLIDHLGKSTTRFDGHKGVALYFDAHHELVQPLYLVEGDEVREELAPMISTSSAAQCR